jgi:rhamnosyltransferase
MIKICSVLTVYYPDVQRLNKVIKQISIQCNIIIVFNSPYSEGIIHPKDTKIIINDKNFGVAKALNQGCIFAMKEGYDYAFILDQDSIPSFNAIDILSSLVSESEKPLIGINVIEEFLNKKSILNTASPFITKVPCVISSGSLVKLSILNELGYFREDFFIDRVDTEYCLRLKKNNYSIYKMNSAYIEHKYGEQSKFNSRRNYPPIRIYYQFRNQIWLYKLYKKYDSGTRVRTIARMLVYQLINEKVTLSIIIGIIKGITYGLFFKPNPLNHIN